MKDTIQGQGSLDIAPEHGTNQFTLQENSEQNQKRLAHPLLYEKTGPAVLVEFDGLDDPDRPTNWPFRKKLSTTILFGLSTCWAMFASTTYSAAITQIENAFQVNSEVSNAGVSLVMFGFAFGPMLWGPLSEVYGRKWTTVIVRIGMTVIFLSSTILTADSTALLPSCSFLLCHRRCEGYSDGLDYPVLYWLFC